MQRPIPRAVPALCTHGLAPQRSVSARSALSALAFSALGIRSAFDITTLSALAFSALGIRSAFDITALSALAFSALDVSSALAVIALAFSALDVSSALAVIALIAISAASALATCADVSTASLEGLRRLPATAGTCIPRR
eukprot:364938-Chlamydomonas_euryale.AAC.46